MAESKKRSRRTSEGSYRDAENLERQAKDPSCFDDSRWLRRMARRMRAVARKKEKAFEHKQSEKQNRRK